jgi:hypothetical protein
MLFRKVFVLKTPCASNLAFVIPTPLAIVLTMPRAFAALAMSDRLPARHAHRYQLPKPRDRNPHPLPFSLAPREKGAEGGLRILGAMQISPDKDMNLSCASSPFT